MWSRTFARSARQITSSRLSLRLACSIAASALACSTGTPVDEGTGETSDAMTSAAGGTAGQGAAEGSAGASAGGTAGGAGGQATPRGGNQGGLVGGQGGSVVLGGMPAVNGCEGIVPPSEGLILWLDADKGIKADAQGRVTSWTDQASGTRAATLQDVAAASFDGGAAAKPTAPRLVTNVINGQAVVRFDGVRDELTLVNPPSVLGTQGLTLAEVAATSKLVKPASEWCNDGGLKDPVIENGCSGTYATTFFWPMPGGPGYSAISLSLMQESVAVQYGTGTRDQKFFWMRPKPTGGAFSRAIAIHNGTTNSLFVDGLKVQEHAAQDGKTVVVNDGKRLDLGVGRYDRHWAGDLPALLIYKRALSADEQQRLDAYLKCRYFTAN